MKDKTVSKDSKSMKVEKERPKANPRCCYYVDPCGCYVDPCGCYVDPCCCC